MNIVKKAVIVSLLTGLSNVAHADIKDDLDSMLGQSWGSLTFTSASTLTPNDLANSNRIAAQFGGMRMRVPVKSFNLVTFTAPSIQSGCSGIDITLGSFSLVSKDELISLFRSIASNALSYGFGQAIHAMCPPCWSGIKTIQEEIRRINQMFRNTCSVAKTLVEGGKDLAINDSICIKQATAGTGDFAACTEGASAARTKKWEQMWNTVLAKQSLGADPESSFDGGNAVAIAFKNQNIEKYAFDQTVTQWIFGINLTSVEVAMNLFGYWNNTPNDSGSFAGFIPSPIKNLTTYFVEGTSGANHSMILQRCADATGTPALDLPCGAPYGEKVGHFAPIHQTLEIEVQELFAALSGGAPFPNGLSDTQKMIANYVDPAMARTLFFADSKTISQLQSAQATFASIIAKKIVTSYLRRVIDVTAEAFTLAANETELLSDHLKESSKRMDEVEKYYSKLKTAMEADIAKLDSMTSYQRALHEFGHSFSQAVATRAKNKS